MSPLAIGHVVHLGRNPDGGDDGCLQRYRRMVEETARRDLAGREPPGLRSTVEPAIPMPVNACSSRLSGRTSRACRAAAAVAASSRIGLPHS
jgi:hypothetical protein